jgi:hypothetical protein
MKRLILVPLFFATAAIGPCNAEDLGSLFPGSNHQPDGGSGPQTACAEHACDGQEITLLACTVGRTLNTCVQNSAQSQCHWQTSCPDQAVGGGSVGSPPGSPPGSVPPAPPATPQTACAEHACDGQEITLLACTVGRTVNTCVQNSAQSQCHWQTSCPDQTPGGSVPPAPPACPSGACDGLPVAGLACANGPTEHICVPGASGACAWQIVCQRP